MRRTILFEGETLAGHVAEARTWLEAMEAAAARHLELRLRGRVGARINPPETGHVRAALTMLEDVEAALATVTRERDEAQAALLNESGQGDPPSKGWEWIQTQHQHGVWVRDHMGTMVQRTTSGVWYWTSVLHGFSPDKIRDTARDAMRAADTALAGAKS